MMIWSVLSRLKHKRAKVKVPYESPPVIDFYRLANLVAKEQATRINEEAHADFIAVTGALTDATVSTDGRVMYYYKLSWWRHPIKRFRQWRAIKKITEEP